MGAKLEMKRTFIPLTVRPDSDAVLNVSDSDELGRRQAAKIVALASEVGLVGVARVGGSLAEGIAVGLDQVEEAPESEDAAEGLGAVTHGPLEPATELALADVEPATDVTDAGGRGLGGDQLDGGFDVRMGLRSLVDPLQERGLEERLLRVRARRGLECAG